MDRVTREKEWYNNYLGSNARAAMKKYGATHAVRREYSKKLLHQKLDHNTVFLDYGCGNGHTLLEVSSIIKKGIGIDISEAYIEEAKSTAQNKGIANVEFFVMDAINTTFKNGTFDIVRGAAILHHLDLMSSLNEIKRILKEDGCGFFIEPLGTNPIISLYRKMTPKARTLDEQPLRNKDIKLIKKVFPNVQIKYFAFFTILATPLRKHKYFLKMLAILYFLDKILLSKWSPFKFLAWMSVLELKK